MDHNNPTKFRKKGGGVLIAVRADLDLEVKKITPDCRAEILSVEINCGDNKFLVISNFYRVDTLGIDNFNEVEKHIISISKKQKYRETSI